MKVSVIIPTLATPNDRLARVFIALQNADYPMTDQVGKKLGGCGYTEMIWGGALRRGLGHADTSRLRLTHVNPSCRLRSRYFARLQLQDGFSWKRFIHYHGLRPSETHSGVFVKILKSLVINLPKGSSGLLTLLRRWGELRGALGTTRENI